MQQNNQQLATQSDYGSMVISAVEQQTKAGLTIPADYNYVNAVKASMLILADMRDKAGNRILDICTPASIQHALLKMVTRGLDASKAQCYFIRRGNTLCCDPSYFGKVLQVKRVFPDWEPLPRVIHEGDVIEYETDPGTGRRRLLKHEQMFENLDKDIIGAYIYLPCLNGGKDLYMMTKGQIVRAWMKSSDKSMSTHRDFMEKMASKTIVNSGCNMIINSTPALAPFADENFESDYEDAKTSSHEVREINLDSIPVAEVVEDIPTKEDKDDF